MSARIGFVVARPSTDPDRSGGTWGTLVYATPASAEAALTEATMYGNTWGWEIRELVPVGTSRRVDDLTVALRSVLDHADAWFARPPHADTLTRSAFEEAVDVARAVLTAQSGVSDAAAS